MKLLILSALFIGCVASASAETKMLGGCELIRIKGSNAYYLSDPKCALGSVGGSAKPRAASRSTPAKSDAVDADQSEVMEPTASESEPEHPTGDLGSGSSHDGDDHDNGPGNDVGGEEASNPSEGGEPVASDKPKDDNGHGNDVGGVDPSNPGQSEDKGGSDEPKDDNGHGNDVGGVDPSNPGQSEDKGGSDEPKDDNGHGNDVGGVDPSNPGQSEDKGGSDKNGGKANGKP
jgi:hypothetical protein